MQKLKIKNQKLEKGISLYLVILISTFILTVALGLSTILISRIKVSREIGYSIVAFYAADTGIERALYERRVNNIIWTGTSTVGNATYTIEWIGDICRSKGTFSGVTRAIEISF